MQTHWNYYLPLAQAMPWEDAPPPPPATQAHRPITFSDFKQSLRDYNSGKINDAEFRNGVLSLLAVAALVLFIIHLRQQRKQAAPPDNLRKLGRELARLVRFPLGTRLLLKCVARATKTPFASLLLSAELFDKCVNQWAQTATFSVARRWGKGRLARLRPVLFE